MRTPILGAFVALLAPALMAAAPTATVQPVDGAGQPLATDANPLVTRAPAATPYRVNSVAGTNATSVKTSAGRVYSYVLCNTAGAARYVRLFDLATAPIPGVSPIAAGPIVVGAGSCQTFSSAGGLTFINGIGLDITGAAGDADTTGVTAGDVAGFLGYQ